MGILDFQQLKVFLPVWALFGKRGRTVAHLNPLNTAIFQLTSRLHVAKVFLTGDRPQTQRAIFDRLGQSIVLARLHSGGYEISHRLDVPPIAPGYFSASSVCAFSIQA
jgi:hypothetical protein